MNQRFTAVIEKESCSVVTLTADQQLLLVIACPHCKTRKQHDILYVGNWLNYHVVCDACGADSLLPNYDWDQEIDELNTLAWLNKSEGTGHE